MTTYELQKKWIDKQQTTLANLTELAELKPTTSILQLYDNFFTPNSSKPELPNLSYDYTVAYGMCNMLNCKIAFSHDPNKFDDYKTTIIHPFIATASLDKLLNKVKSLEIELSLLSPYALTAEGYLAAKNDVINYLKGLIEVAASVYINTNVHEALHKGFLEKLNVPSDLAAGWTSVMFCEKFDQIGKIFEDLSKAMLAKKKLLSVIYKDPFFALWSSALTQANTPVPWWLGEETKLWYREATDPR